MPCRGPSQELAYQRADEVTEGILKLLAGAYLIKEPSSIVLGKKLKKDHEDAKLQLRDAMRELFWIDACDSF